MDTTNLVRPTTIAARLGVSRQAVVNWETRHADYPLPAITIDDVRFWDWPTVRAWDKGRKAAGASD